MPSIEPLAPFAANDPGDFEELRQTCLKIIRAWIAADGEPWDELVHDFFLIDAQGDDVAADPEAGAREKADFFRVFYPVFIEARDAIFGVAGKR